MLRIVFSKFLFFGLFWPPGDQKMWFLPRGGSKKAKKWKFWKSDSLTFFVSLFSITGPNFMFLALFYQELNRKMCFWDIAILVKIREFPLLWPSFGHIPRDKTPVRHFPGIFHLLNVRHRITQENILKPVRMTETWWKFFFSAHFEHDFLIKDV